MERAPTPPNPRSLTLRSSIIACARSMPVANGGSHISKKMTPSEYMSALWSYGADARCSCSGAR